MPLDCYDTPPPADGGQSARPFIGVLFECCGVYARIYRRPNERHYVGRCPKCLGLLRVRVGPDGTRSRLFRAR